MAEERKKEKVNVNALAQGLIRFLNIFPDAESLREECQKVLDLEGEVARLKQEAHEAENARVEAVRKRKVAEFDLQEAVEKHERAKRAHADARQEEAAALVRFKIECAKKTEEIRAEQMKEQTRIMAETQELEFKRGNLAKVVREMERPPGDPEPSASARVEP
jgi:hypothetical protein